jgi:hypothetical protein
MDADHGVSTQPDPQLSVHVQVAQSLPELQLSPHEPLGVEQRTPQVADAEQARASSTANPLVSKAENAIAARRTDGLITAPYEVRAPRPVEHPILVHLSTDMITTG